MTTRAQWLTLLLLSGIWGGVALWVFASAPEPSRVPLAHVTGSVLRAESERTHADTGLNVNLAALAAARVQVRGVLVAPKNIFAPVSAPARSAAEGLPKPSASVGAPTVPPPPSPEELATQAARQELARFRYLGYLSRQGGEEAFLSKGADLYVVKGGDMIEQRVLVKAISPAGVTLQEPQSRVEHLLALVGGR